jgi:formamidopyrimidine-DNA glycosylase
MPELPDITVYIEALEKRVLGRELLRVSIRSPFLLRTFDPPLESQFGKTVRELRRLGKRIVFGFDDDLWIVLHLMIAGRLHWKAAGAKASGRNSLAAFEFSNGTLVLTEAGTKHRAALFVVRGEEGLRAHDPGGLEIMSATLEQFEAALRAENHTLKFALTNPRSLSGIGNAYSDEILHRARLSPLLLTRKMTSTDVKTLFDATRAVLQEWVERLRAETGEGFPERVTAFRLEMAVHGRFGLPCPDCGSPVQRIRYADNETNYCARCQTKGRVLADRSLSRLLKDDWPKHIDEID